ncbi:MAG: nuclear transport factor 2 family protein [Solirubrobacteraceae bacterium]
MSAHDAFRAAIEAADHEGIVATLAPGAVLRSPVSFKPFEGREAVAALMEVLLKTFKDFHYTDAQEADGVSLLVFNARVGERDVEGVDLIRWNADGQAAEITVFVRPLSAVIALAEAVGPQLEGAGLAH